MKKILTPPGIFLSLIVIVVACKHETLPVPKPPDVAVIQSCSADTVYFQQKILPAFISNCATSGCHNDASHRANVILTSYATIMSTGSIKAGDAANSGSYKRIIATNKPMPPLPRPAVELAQAELIKKWINQGANNNACGTNACDTFNVSYSNSVKNTLAAQCTGCHGATTPGGGYDLTTYAGVKARVTDGKLWGSMNHSSGYSAMPKNGNKLSGCDLATIKKWIEAGAPNN